MRWIGILVIVSTLASCVPARASETKDGTKISPIQVEIGKVTEVSFPESVAKVVKGGQPDSILVEVVGHSLYLLPKTDHPPDLFVTTTSGMSYPLVLELSAEHDIKVQIGNSTRFDVAPTEGGYGDVMGLMKDLLLHREPAGATILSSEAKVVLPSSQITLTLTQAYEIGEWKAFVMTAKNMVRQPVVIPTQHIQWPGLLAISTDRDLLEPSGEDGDQGLVYIIVQSAIENYVEET